MQRGAERVALEHVGNHLGDDNGALSAKSFFYAYHDLTGRFVLVGLF
jgi:hypothetical protein